MVAVTKTIVPLGLNTDYGPFTTAPEGSLTKAQNIFIQNGVIKPRPGLKMYVDDNLFASSYRIRHGSYIEERGEYTWSLNDYGTTWRMRRDRTDTITGPSNFTLGSVHDVFSRGRLLFTSDDGVCEMPESSADTVAYRAGLPQPTQIMAYAEADTAGWLVDGDVIGYRFVLKRTRADGTVMRSAPSSIIYVRYRDSGGTYPNAYVVIDGTVASYTNDLYDVDSTFDTLVSGDELEVYRGYKTSDLTYMAPCDDEMRLRATLSITSGAIAPFEDKLADDAWSGPALYTNSTQQGVLQGNQRPNLASDICNFNEMALYSQYRSPHRIALSLNAIDDTVGSAGAIFGCTNPLVALTAGATTISVGATFLSGITVGMYVTMDAETYGSFPGSADTYFAANTVVTAVDVATSTVTISAAILATIGSVRVTFWDWLEVSDASGSFKIFPSEEFFSGNEYFFLITKYHRDSTNLYFGGYPSLEYKFNNSSARIKDIRLFCSGQTENVGISLLFERASFTDDTFTVKSTKPLAFDKYVDSVTGITSAQDGGGARLGISKTSIPDAVPLLNYVDIGDLTSDIVRIIPVNDFVYVFKRDGLYRVYGPSPDSLTVEMIDSTIVPIDNFAAGEWITQSGNEVFCVTKKGIYQISNGAPYLITDGILSLLWDKYGVHFDSLNDSNAPYPYYLFLSCGVDLVDSYFMINGAYDDDSNYECFVYNLKNQTWTSWRFSEAIRCFWNGQYGKLKVGLYDGVEGNFYYTPIAGSVGAVMPVYSIDIYPEETGTYSGVTNNGDGSYTINVLSSASFGGGRVEGNLVSLGNIGKWGFISEHISTGSKYKLIYHLLDTDTWTFSSSGVAYYGTAPEYEIQFAPDACGDPTVLKRYQSIGFIFNNRKMFVADSPYIKMTFEGYRNKSDGTVPTAEVDDFYHSWDVTDPDYVWRSQEESPEYLWTSTPREVSEDWNLKHGISIKQAFCYFELCAIYVEFSPETNLINRGKS